MAVSLSRRLQGNPSRTGRTGQCLPPGTPGRRDSEGPRVPPWRHLSSLPAWGLEARWPSLTLGQSKAPRWATGQPGWGPLSVPVPPPPPRVTPSSRPSATQQHVADPPAPRESPQPPPSLQALALCPPWPLRPGRHPRVPGGHACLHPHGRTRGPHLPGAVPGRETQRGGCWDGT